MITRRGLAGLAAATALSSGLRMRAAAAQAWPSRHVRLIVPFVPAGATDAIARTVGHRLSEVWGQQVVIENKPGAGANIGAQMVAQAGPDGYTLFITSVPHATNRFLYRSLDYDPVADFAPVTLICMQPNLMVVPSASPAKSVLEFVAHAKANAGKITPALPQVRSGNARGLAVTTGARVPVAPELPTIAEAGVPGFDVSSWFAFFVPAKTPAPIIEKMHKDIVAALAYPEVRERLEPLGAALVGSTPDELARHLKSEMDKWGPVIRDAGIRIDG